jgi:hypothetical protein
MVLTCTPPAAVAKNIGKAVIIQHYAKAVAKCNKDKFPAKPNWHDLCLVGELSDHKNHKPTVADWKWIWSNNTLNDVVIDTVNYIMTRQAPRNQCNVAKDEYQTSHQYNKGVVPPSGLSELIANNEGHSSRD